MNTQTIYIFVSPSLATYLVLWDKRSQFLPLSLSRACPQTCSHLPKSPFLKAFCWISNIRPTSFRCKVTQEGPLPHKHNKEFDLCLFYLIFFPGHIHSWAPPHTNIPSHPQAKKKIYILQQPCMSNFHSDTAIITRFSLLFLATPFSSSSSKTHVFYWVGEMTAV